jgi:hypothetical protein
MAPALPQQIKEKGEEKKVSVLVLRSAYGWYGYSPIQPSSLLTNGTLVKA